MASVKDLMGTGAHGSSTGGASGRQAALNQQAAANNAIANWVSVFPNVNYELLNDDWEKKIMIDPEVLLCCFFFLI